MPYKKNFQMICAYHDNENLVNINLFILVTANLSFVSCPIYCAWLPALWNFLVALLWSLSSLINITICLTTKPCPRYLMLGLSVLITHRSHQFMPIFFPLQDEICKSISENGGIDASLKCIDDSSEHNNKITATACCSLLSKVGCSCLHN